MPKQGRLTRLTCMLCCEGDCEASKVVSVIRYENNHHLMARGLECFPLVSTTETAEILATAVIVWRLEGVSTGTMLSCYRSREETKLDVS